MACYAFLWNKNVVNKIKTLVQNVTLYGAETSTLGRKEEKKLQIWIFYGGQGVNKKN